MTDSGETQPSKLEAQLNLILNGALPDSEAYPLGSHRPSAARLTDATGAPVDVGAVGDFGHLARRGHVLVRDADIDRVSRHLGGQAVETDGNLNGLTRWEFDAGRFAHVEEACRELDTRVGRGVVTPDHLLVLVGFTGVCPATEPEPTGSGATAAAPVPPILADEKDGAGVLVHILDSGLSPDSGRFPWLTGVTGDAEDPYEPGSTQIKSYAGHGTFSAGVVRTVAPAADVHVQQTFRVAGTVYESEMVGDVQSALSAGADVLSMSFGTYTRERIPLLGLDVVEKMLHDYKGVVLVAAAGNDNGREPFFPAASPHAVSVGALTLDGNARAAFSNYGGWVDVFAPGQDLENAFLTGDFAYVEPPNIGRTVHFDGMARWSGTSFSTPMVAGLIAARMSVTGENGKQAARALLEQARISPLHGVGATLRPGHKYW
jgi:subtilase family protein